MLDFFQICDIVFLKDAIFFNRMKYVNESLQVMEDSQVYPDIKVLQSASGPEVVIEGKKILLFCSNNYLGLANDERVKWAEIQAIQNYGVGSGASRIVAGTIQLHLDLEQSIARFKSGEDALVFSSGYAANISVIKAVMDLFTIEHTSKRIESRIFSDELNHASIIDGCKFSNVPVNVYRHFDMRDLEDQLMQHSQVRKLIVTDGVFSMNGDIAPLDKIVFLARKYDAMVMVDDAHATGVIGENGRGTMEHFHISEGVDIVMGTFSKAIGVIGGFIVGTKNLIKFLKVASRSFVFSTALPPGDIAAIIQSLKIVEFAHDKRKKLFENAKVLRDGLIKMGFYTFGSETQIIPALFGSEKKGVLAQKLLFEKGILASCIQWPAVERGKSRIRLTVMSNHSIDQIHYLLKQMGSVGRQLQVIQ